MRRGVKHGGGGGGGGEEEREGRGRRRGVKYGGRMKVKFRGDSGRRRGIVGE